MSKKINRIFFVFAVLIAIIFFVQFNKAYAFCCNTSTYTVTATMSPSGTDCNGSYTIGGSCLNQSSENTSCTITGGNICYKVDVYCSDIGQAGCPQTTVLQASDQTCQPYLLPPPPQVVGTCNFIPTPCAQGGPVVGWWASVGDPLGLHVSCVGGISLSQDVPSSGSTIPALTCPILPTVCKFTPRTPGVFGSFECGLTTRPPAGPPIAPTASVTIPIDYSVSNAFLSGTLTMSANASDDEQVVGVQYFMDVIGYGTEIAGQPAGIPYLLAWDTTLSIDGLHNINVRARDNDGLLTSSPFVSVYVDNTNPTVSLTSPINLSTVSGIVSIQANATDPVVNSSSSGVAGTEFFINGVSFQNISAPGPYSLSWDTTTGSYPDGIYSITAQARDNAGNVGPLTSISVTVSNSIPSASMTAPINGVFVRGANVPVSANAADTNGIAGVQFKIGGSNFQPEDTIAPYGVSWDTTVGYPDGIYSLGATARNPLGATGNAIPVSVTVDNTLPVVNITQPLASPPGPPAQGAVTIQANATDATSGMAGVQFRIDGTNFGAEVIGSGPTFTAGSWDTTVLSNGTSHTITAIARDNAGNTNPTSITVTVYQAASVTTFNGTPSPINPGECSKLQQTTTNATSCTVDTIPPVGGIPPIPVPPNCPPGCPPSETVCPKVTQVYGLTCTGPGGTSPTVPTTINVRKIPAFIEIKP